MLTIIVNDANFQARVMTLPKDDFPIEMYDVMLSNSVLTENGRRTLYQKIVWMDNIGTQKPSNWSSITNEIYKIVDWWEDPNMSKPDWCNNATTTRDHGYLDSKALPTIGETFEVVQCNYTDKGKCLDV